MAGSGQEGEQEGGLRPSERRLIPFAAPIEPGGRNRRDPPSVGVWKRPGAGAVPTRPIESIYGFSLTEPQEEEPGDTGPDPPGLDPVLVEARKRAFALLDQWLAWIVVADEDSFGGRNYGGDPAHYRFVNLDPIADPGDVVRYGLRSTSLFL